MNSIGSNLEWSWAGLSKKIPDKTTSGKPWPKITVVTPTYNQGNYIEETILSIISQNYPNLEYIIIDGGSTDNTLEIIEKYKPYISYFVSEKDNGQTHAINKGMAKATGEILAYLNSDDVYLPYTFRLVAEIFTRWPEVRWMTGHRSHLIDKSVIAPLPNATVRFNKELYTKGFHLQWMLGWNQQPSTFWTRELFDKAGGQFNETFTCSMDIDLWIKMAKHTDLYYIRAILALMRQHSEQKSRNLRADYTEIEGKAKLYGFYPLALRKALISGMKTPGIRSVLRKVWKNPKAPVINWDPIKGDWFIEQKRIF